MISGFQTNRITTLFDNSESVSTQTKPSRSERQRQASRKNGSRSRGPTSIAGKARAKINALKHGLLTKVIVPPQDARGQDLLFKNIHRRLMEEFKPATFTEHSLVDAMASDFVMVVRARALLEALHRPPPISAHDLSIWQTAQENRKRLDCVEDGLRWCADPNGLGLDDEEAGWLAERIKTFVEATLADLANPNGNEDETPLETWELEDLKATEAVIGPAKKRFCNPSHVADILTGRRHPVTGDLDRFSKLLKLIKNHIKFSLESRSPVERSVQAVLDNHNAGLALTPEKLILMQRYLTRAERAIERKIRLLSR